MGTVGGACAKCMGPAKNTFEKVEYFVYNSVRAQYFRYKHPWTHILYSK
jgi:hypothetical protein